MINETLQRTARKLTAFLKKYKYPALVLLLGLALLLLPFGHSETEAEPTETATEQSDHAEQTEEKLADILSQISGAGQVRVMLTLERGELTQYQTDTQTSSDAERVQEERKTVILSAGSAYDEAAVSTVLYPCFRGALVVCEGAESAVVRLEIVQAVSAVTGLGADKITVVKMK